MLKLKLLPANLWASVLLLSIMGCATGDECNKRFDTVIPPEDSKYDLKAHLKDLSTKHTLIHKILAEYHIEDTDTTEFSQPESSNKGVERRLVYAYGSIINGNQQGAINALEPLVGYEFDNNEIRFAVFHTLGLAYQRKGEIENCTHHHNADACILPFSSNATHQLRDGSSKAILYYSQALEAMPDDPTTRWLLTICFETLGQQHAADIQKHLIHLNSFDKPYRHGSFKDVALELGIADFTGFGGMLVEDFNNDGLLDVFNTSFELHSDPNIYFNNGTSFVKKTAEAGLSGITGAENVIQADYNNDGFIDLLILRGGWLESFGMLPQSLLKNNGDGTFTDVTKEVGMLAFHPSHSAAWADVNNDGWLDLLVANENFNPNAGSQLYCRLYVSKRDGTFKEMAKEANLRANFYVKGIGSGDFNNDGLPDFYLSCYNEPNLLFINTTTSPDSIKFENRTDFAGVSSPYGSFPVAVFDFNNDGWDDILVTGYDVNVREIALEYLSPDTVLNPSKLYLNKGNGTFIDATEEAALNRSIYAMGLNYGDIDNDGFLDIYAATGVPDYRGLYPNLMFRNVMGTHFEDVTAATRTGHLQKGHGVSFADYDNDGDQDLFVEIGGIYPDDRFFNALFQNPGNGRNWVRIKLVGTACNRSAIGAKIKLTVEESSGATRYIYRTVNHGASYGANPLEQFIGVGKANIVKEIEVFWPDKRTSQIIVNAPVNKGLILTQGMEHYQIVNYPPLQMISPNPLLDQVHQGHHHH